MESPFPHTAPAAKGSTHNDRASPPARIPAGRQLLYLLRSKYSCRSRAVSSGAAITVRCRMGSSKNRGSRASARPGFHRAADDNIFISLTPVRGQAFRQPVYALRKKVEPTVPPPAHHLPAVRPPCVRVLQQKVGGKAVKITVPAGIFQLPSRLLRIGRSKAAFLRHNDAPSPVPYISSCR